MLWTLIKVQLVQMFSRQKTSNKKKKKSSGTLGAVMIAVLLLICFVSFAILFGSVFWAITTALTEEIRWLYFALAATMAFLLMVIGSVFTAKNQLYEAKDNELLLSMPIPSAYILAARIMSLLLLNYFFEALIYVPAAVVYGLVYGYSVMSFIFMAVGFFVLGLLSIAVISILAFLIEAASKKIKNKRIITVIFSFAFFAAYMYACSNLQSLADYVIANIDSVRQIIRTYITPAYFLGSAVSDGSVVSFGLYLLCTVLPFAVIYFILSKTFISIASSQNNGVKRKYKEKKMSVRSPMAALVLKEITRFGTSTVYMFNAGLGLVFSPIVAVVFSVKMNSSAQDLVELFYELFGSDKIMDYIMLVVIFVVLLIGGMDMISACSVSLEGKALWIPKSIPVMPHQILLSKVYAHIIICTPFSVITGIILWIGLKMSFLIGLFAVIVPTAYCALVGYIGLLINLKKPRFDWINETYAVKQGSAVLLTMLAVLGVDGLLAVPCIFLTALTSVELVLGLVLVIICALIFLLHYVTVHSTRRIFFELGE